MKKILILVALVALISAPALASASGSTVNPNESKKMYVGAILNVSSAPSVSVDGNSPSSTGNGAGGGLNLMFNYNVWKYIGVGADFDVTGWSHSGSVKTSTDIAISPTVKGFYDFAPQGVPGLEVYARFGFGYARIINPTKGYPDWNAFAFKFMFGSSYDIPKLPIFVLAEMGVTHRTFKEDVPSILGSKSFTCNADAFTFGLGVGYRF